MPASSDTRTRQWFAVLITTVVSLTAALATPAVAVAAAGSLRANPSAVVAGEGVVLSGVITPRIKRTVVLQRKSGSTWTKVARKSSTARGTFTFTATARDRSTTYRVYAPPTTVNGRTRAATSTPSRTVKTLTQSVSLELPGSAVTGTTSTAATAFTPVRAGRPVTLEVLGADGVWTRYGTGSQSASGEARFTVSHGTAGSWGFRAVAEAWKGAAKAISPVRTVAVIVPTPPPPPPGDTTPPGPITSLTITGATTSTLDLSWTNPSDTDYAGAVIRRATGTTPPTSPTSGTAVTTTGATTTTHQDTGLNPSTTYSYALFARDEVPNYAPPATGQGTTTTPPPGDTTPPGPITSLTITGATTSTLNLSWTNPSDTDYAGAVIRRATGTTPPTSPTSGTAVTTTGATTTTHQDTGLNPSTTYSYALFARDEVPNYASPATGQGTTTTPPPATTSDWTQSRNDAGHRGWSPTETAITPANAGDVGEEWSMEGGGTPVIANGVAYVHSAGTLNGAGQLAAFQLSTGAQLWKQATGSCNAGPLAVTTDLVVLGCGAYPRAYARGGAHELVWDTAEAEAGQASHQYILVTGDRLVAWSNTRLAAYRLSDGARTWNLLLPSGADTLRDVAASGSTVVAAYNDRLRALALTNGAQLWSKTGVITPQMVVADGWIYTNNESSFGRYALADGAPGWSQPATYSFGRIEAVDADTVYVWDPLFDFGPPSPSVLRALSTTDGSLRWEYYVPSRIGSVAVTGEVVWVTSTDIYNQGRNGDLIALDRATGSERRHVHFEDNIYGWTNVAFGAGKVVLDQGGSFGGSTPRTLRVFGLAGRVPTVTTGVLPVGRVGSPYSFDLESAAASPTWTVASGTLPAGITLSPAGALTGSPSAPATVRVTLRATANGRTAERAFTLQVVPASTTPGWATSGRDATGNPFEPGTGALGLGDAPSLSFRWKTAPPGAVVSGNRLDVVTAGDRMYGVQWDGMLKAWDTTGSTANRAPAWAVKPDGMGFRGGATVAGNRILVRDDSGDIHARDLATGAALWNTTSSLGFPFGDEGPLVVGSTVVVRDGSNVVRAFSLTDGAPLWGGAAAPVSNVYRPVSSDGTRIFAVAQCRLYALSLANGSVLWDIPMSDSQDNCGLPANYQGAPVVANGMVHATELGVRVVAAAATGIVQLRFRSSGYWGHTSVVAGGAWIYLEGEEIVAVDTTSGDLLWRIKGDWRGARVSAVQDLVLVATEHNLYGFSRLTGEQVWDGGSVSAHQGTPVVHGNRIFMAAQDGVRAYGPL